LNNDHIRAAWQLDILPNSLRIQTEPDFCEKLTSVKEADQLVKKKLNIDLNQGE